MTLMTKRHYDLVLTAHLHHFSADEKNQTASTDNASQNSTNNSLETAVTNAMSGDAAEHAPGNFENMESNIFSGASTKFEGSDGSVTNVYADGSVVTTNKDGTMQGVSGDGYH